MPVSNKGWDKHKINSRSSAYARAWHIIHMDVHELVNFRAMASKPGAKLQAVEATEKSSKEETARQFGMDPRRTHKRSSQKYVWGQFT